MSGALFYLEDFINKKKISTKEKSFLKPEIPMGKIIKFKIPGKECASDDSSDFGELLRDLNSNFQIGKRLILEMEKIAIDNGDQKLVSQIKIFRRKFSEIFRMTELLED